jgi:hypothetical protein
MAVTLDSPTDRDEVDDLYDWLEEQPHRMQEFLAVSGAIVLGLQDIASEFFGDNLEVPPAFAGIRAAKPQLTFVPQDERGRMTCGVRDGPTASIPRNGSPADPRLSSNDRVDNPASTRDSPKGVTLHLAL